MKVNEAGTYKQKTLHYSNSVIVSIPALVLCHTTVVALEEGDYCCVTAPGGSSLLLDVALQQ